MFDLIDIGGSILPQLPLLNIKIEDIRIDLAPSPVFPLPVIRIDAKLEIKLGF